MVIELEDPRFKAWPSGRFMARVGGLGEHAPFSKQKLCLVATDPTFLIDLLYGLSLREDCSYVKYGTISREGMYLGRCWMQSDRAAAELCQELKGHPRVMVSLQDDELFNTYRDPPVPDDSCGVWDDWVEHTAELAELHEQALSTDEVALVTRLCAAREATISLVAQRPPPDRKRDRWPIIGHVVLSRVTIEARDEPRGLRIAAITVVPEHRRRGVGRTLMERALRRAKLLGHSYLVTLDHPEYYSRFGFAPASRFGLRSEQPISDEAFLALELTAGALDGVSGVVRT